MEVRDYHLQIFHPHRNDSSPHLRSRISDPSTHNSLPGECWKPSHMKSVLQMKEKLFHWTTLGPQSRGHFVHLSGQVDTGRSLCLGWSTFFGTKTDLEKWKHPKWWNLKLSFSFRLISTFCRILWFQAPQIFLKTIEKKHSWIGGLNSWFVFRKLKQNSQKGRNKRNINWFFEKRKTIIWSKFIHRWCVACTVWAWHSGPKAKEKHAKTKKSLLFRSVSPMSALQSSS